MTPELPKPEQMPLPTSWPSTTPPARNGAQPAADRNVAAVGPRVALPIAGARPPTAIACLQCQLIGRRRLTCSKADRCEELPHSFALGPVLLAAWLVTTIAFVITVL